MTIKLEDLLVHFVEKSATDLYINVGSPASFRYGHEIRPYNDSKLTNEDVNSLLAETLTEEQLSEFEATLEYNSALSWKNGVRFRINAFRQQQSSGMVLRRIQSVIPTLEQLHLPKIYGDLIMERRGLILLVGPTGSGKSTSLAAMLEHRNQHGSGHIVTIEDPVEFIHTPKNCIITQRDVGIDTYSFGIALKNMLRQTPDVIVIGEIRDRDTMEHAIVFSETGHLCLATLHANNANQAIERIINFFPDERHRQLLLNLSLNLKGIMSQRLLANQQGGRSIALEIMLNQGIIRTLINEGRVKEMKEYIEKARDMGMQSFDQALLDLYRAGTISEEVAIGESDNSANLRLSMKQHEMISSRLSSSRAAPLLPEVERINKNSF